MVVCLWQQRGCLEWPIKNISRFLKRALRLEPVAQSQFSPRHRISLGQTLGGSELSVANLSGARLYGAKLSFAHLRLADLREADLSRAILLRANLRQATFKRA